MNLVNINNHLVIFFVLKPEEFYRRGTEMLPGRWEKVLQLKGHDLIDKKTCLKNEFFNFQ